MPRLAERQRAFAAALLDPKLPTPAGLVGPDGKVSAKRFAVYRNNIAVALGDALQANFPAVCRIVGEEFFRAMARAFSLSQLPVSPILLDYGQGFPNFIGQFAPAAPLPYLADVARIERAWTEAYYAQEALPLAAGDLLAVPSEAVPRLVMSVHPSLRIVSSQFPALTIWRMNIADGEPAPVDLTRGGQDVLIIRPVAKVEVQLLPSAGAEFIQAVARGRPLIDAAKSAFEADAQFNLSASLAALISAGAFVGYRMSTQTDKPPRHRRGG